MSQATHISTSVSAAIINENQFILAAHTRHPRRAAGAPPVRRETTRCYRREYLLSCDINLWYSRAYRWTIRSAELRENSCILLPCF